MPDENEGSFKVTDRRIFNPDGTIREDALREEREVPVDPVEPQPAADQVSAHSTPETHPDEDQEAGLGGDFPGQTMFMDFLMGISTSAFIHLGLMPHPGTGQKQLNLEGARESIDMLAMLQDKTRGNLTSDEDQFFEELLADLRMRFVSMRK